MFIIIIMRGCQFEFDIFFRVNETSFHSVQHNNVHIYSHSHMFFLIVFFFKLRDCLMVLKHSQVKSIFRCILTCYTLFPYLTDWVTLLPHLTDRVTLFPYLTDRVTIFPYLTDCVTLFPLGYLTD